MKPALVLLSGGLDSATCLAMAKADGYAVHALSFAYGQRHAAELQAAQKLAAECGVTSHRVVTLDLGSVGGSALTDTTLNVPTHRNHDEISAGIPITYVPARNTLFLSYALAYAEVMGCFDIFIGVNALDYSGYPDCRPEYITAFESMANLALAACVEGKGRLTIHAPLQHLSKKEIIQRGATLGVPYHLTISCYDADAEGRACGVCDSCLLRIKGFHEASTPDPTRYRL